MFHRCDGGVWAKDWGAFSRNNLRSQGLLCQTGMLCPGKVRALFLLNVGFNTAPFRIRIIIPVRIILVRAGFVNLMAFLTLLWLFLCHVFPKRWERTLCCNWSSLGWARSKGGMWGGGKNWNKDFLPREWFWLWDETWLQGTVLSVTAHSHLTAQ